ncbi:MAG: YybS family protein [Peptococcaceae bacterium]|nr:YybS family protein [Peptococcaceae bacterium]MDH7523783.1 YybS family protein [Peptococcaceae bacterium]
MAGSLRTKAIAEGALMAVITAFLAVAGLYIPFMQLLIFFVWTIPGVLVIVRHGPAAGILSIAVAGFMILIIAGPMRAFFAVLQFGGLALVYGYAFSRRWQAGVTLLAGSAVMIVSTLVLYYLVYLLTGINNLNIAGELKEAVEPTIELYKNMGIIGPGKGLSEAMLRESLLAAVEFLTAYFPAIFALSGVASAFLNYFAAQKILYRFKIEIPGFPPFIHWRLPWWTVWGFIAGFGASMAGNYWHNNVLTQIGNNIIMLYGPLLFIIGLSVCAFLMQKYVGQEFIYRLIFLSVVVFFFSLTYKILFVVGLLDLFFDYRRIQGEN